MDFSSSILYVIILKSLLIELLCGGTNLGHIAIWHKASEESNGWVQHRGSQVRGAIKHLAWGDVLLAVNTVSAVYILREQKLCSAFRDMVSNLVHKIC